MKERYRKDIFREALEEGPERTLATSYVGFTRRLSKLVTEDDFLLKIDELSECVIESDPAPESTMATLISMLRRHASNVLEVLSGEIADARRELAAGSLPPTCLVALQPPTVVGRPLLLQVQPLPLTASEDEAFKEADFKSRLPIHITGRLSGKKSNVIIVNGVEVHLDDADFVFFLRLVLQLWLSEDGFLSLDSIRFGTGMDSEEELIPRGHQQALGRLRKYFRGRVGNLSHLEFIESRRAKVRLSTHRRYVMIEVERLLTHENERVRRIAERIKAAQEQQRWQEPESL